MREDTALRFELVDRLMQLPYGDTMGIEADMAIRAWPATGDADPSIEAGLLAMAIASRGGSPISSYTTAERITRDLDESFAPPEFIPYSQPPVWRIHRKMRACPKCCGTGWHRAPKAFAEIDLIFSYEGDVLRATDTVLVETVECNHRAT